MSDLTAAVEGALATDRAEFTRRARAEVEGILSEVDRGTFDNPQGAVGLEYEFYAVAEPAAASYSDDAQTDCALERVPRRLLEYVGFEKELGLHNAEMSTQPEPLNAHGLRAQEASVSARLAAAREPTRAAGLRLVSDGLWTIPPTGETTAEYLGATAEQDGVTLASNMSSAPRYHAIANTGGDEMAMRIAVPHATIDTETIMPVSLTTSIQPHYQVPRARDLPEYFRYALRVAGPLLALAVNSPLLPPDCYDDGADPRAILADGWAEHRVPVFEATLNPPDAEGNGRVGPSIEGSDGEPGSTPDRGKVRFPRDVETVRTALERIAGDETVVPMPVTTGDRFDDEFAHFRLKHGTYWRWVRPVFGGASRSAANARIEFRPLGGQPTVRDTVALQAAFAGALVGLVRSDHPVADLPWGTARENFYAAARDGLDAELTWIDADGTETTDATAAIEDLLDAAALGLEAQGLDRAATDRYLDVLRERVDRGVTPAAWRRAAVRRRLDAGEEFVPAVRGAQRAYVANQRETLLEGSFVDWLD